MDGHTFRKVLHYFVRYQALALVASLVLLTAPLRAATDDRQVYAGTVGAARVVVELEGSGDTDMTILVVDENGARYVNRIDPASRSFQLRFRPQLLPGGPCDVRLYRDTLGEMIVRFTTEEETMHIEQYFRALHLSA